MHARTLQPELMDDPALDAANHRRALAGLARINVLCGASRELWHGVREVCGQTDGVASRPLRVLDVATGSGDVLLGLCRRAVRAGVALDASACDISDVALESAAARFARAGFGLRTLRVDANEPLPIADRTVDIAVSSLFFHHLRDADAVRILAEMARVSAVGVVVLDLLRCAPGLLAARVVPRLVTTSRVVHVDAVLSVKAAFTESEMRGIVDGAGLRGASVRRAFPWRMTVAWRRPADGP